MPKTAVEAGELADQYMQARGAVRSTGSANVKQEKRPVERRCHECKEVGHLARECPNKNKISKGSDRRDPKEKRPLICFNCHQRGHKATECPSNALCCEEQSFSNAGGGKSPCREGSVNGKLVKDIVLDTGCSRTMVRRELIREDDLTGEAITIRCAHGDTVLYPLALVRISVDGRILNVEAAASTTLPVSVLLGTDVPQLGGLLDNHDTCLAVMTRSQRQQQAEQEAREARIERE